MPGRRFVALLVVLAVTACAPATADAGGNPLDSKTGGVRALSLKVVSADGTLRFPGQIMANETFVAALKQASDDRISAEMISTYLDGDPNAEATLVHDLASGLVQVAVVATRGYTAAGVGHLDVVEAPFTIESYEAEKELVASPVADELLGRLDGTGIKGLALVVGPLRRPVAADRALLGVSDWSGQKFRTYASPAQDAVVRALGGSPVHDTFEWYEHILNGDLHGGEGDVGLLVSKDAHRGIVVTDNVVLWPKVYVLAVNEQFWAGLSDTQRQWFTDAAKSVRDQSVAAPFDESGSAASLCAAGVRFATASEGQQAELRAAVAPVLSKLSADPVLAELQAIAASHPVYAVPVGDSCRSASPPPASPTPSPTGSPIAMLPDGTYRTTVTEEQVQAVGDTNSSGSSGTWTLVVSNGGDYNLSCQPNTGSTHDCGNAGAGAYGGPLEAGTIRPDPLGLQIDSLAKAIAAFGRCTLPAQFRDGYCNPDETYFTGPWSAHGESYTFARPSRATYALWWVHPWTRLS